MPQDKRPETFHHYRVLRREDGSLWELGRGAMGVTYKAEDTNLRTTVALKVINALFLNNPTARDRFVREARAAASLRHRNVAAVYHLGQDDQTYFYAMEFIDGATVESIIRQHGPQPWRVALRYMLQSARALMAAHEKHLVHRDIKPTNLMLVAEAGEDELVVKMIDFGLAKSLVEIGGSVVSLSGSGFIGTPLFASPEQCEEIAPDIRSDIYSLGVVLWFALTSKPLFSGPLGRVFAQHISAEPPWHDLPADLPEPVLALLARMLAKDRARRQQTPAELRREIEGILHPGSEAATLAPPLPAREPAAPALTIVEPRRFVSDEEVSATIVGYPRPPAAEPPRSSEPPALLIASSSPSPLSSPPSPPPAPAAPHPVPASVAPTTPPLPPSVVAVNPAASSPEGSLSQRMSPRRSLEHLNAGSLLGFRVKRENKVRAWWPSLRPYLTKWPVNVVLLSLVLLIAAGVVTFRSGGKKGVPTTPAVPAAKPSASAAPASASGPSETNKLTALLTEARSAFLAARLPEAVDAYSRVLELSPNSLEALDQRGSAYLMLGQPDKARTDFSRAVIITPSAPQEFYYRGNAYGSLDKPEEASRDYAVAAAGMPATDAFDFTLRGNLFTNLKKYEEAIRDYNEAIRLNPQNAATFNNRGNAYDGLKKYDEAIRDYSEAIRLNPRYATTFYNRGNAYNNVGKYREAVKDCTDALRFNPRDARTLNNRGFALYNLQRYDEAVKDYSEAIRLNPQNVSAFNNRASAYSGLKRFGDAVKDYTEAIRLNPQNAALYYNRSNAFFGLKRYAETAQDCTDALRLNPSFREAYLNRAAAYRAMGNKAAALKDEASAKN